MKYHVLLDALIRTNQLASVEKEINSNSQYKDKFTFESSQGYKFHSLSITLNRFSKLPEWPVFILIKKPLDDDNRLKPLRVKIKVRVHPIFDNFSLSQSWEQLPHNIQSRYAEDFTRKVSDEQKWLTSTWIDLNDLTAYSLSNNLTKLLEIESMLMQEINSKK